MTRKSLFAIGITLTGLFPWNWGKVPEPLVVRGKSAYTIVVGEACSPAERHAADEFSHFIKEISGATLPITSATASLAGPVVCIGQSKRLSQMVADLKLDGLATKASSSARRGAGWPSPAAEIAARSMASMPVSKTISAAAGSRPIAAGFRRSRRFAWAGSTAASFPRSNIATPTIPPRATATGPSATR